jgi:hypothetical protein
MLPLSQTLTALFSQTGFWPVVLVAALAGFLVCLFRLAHTFKASPSWGVRKGECPFCGHVLFGTRHDYQRMSLLDTMPPESQYLCTDCDKERVAGLLSLMKDGQ